jgi:glycosyltransferase involved in cell wall biosynthesis
VHVHFGYVVRDVVPFVSKTGLPLVLSLHGDDATALPRRQRGHYEPVVDAVAAVIVPSAFLADVVAAIGFDRSRIHVIPSGVDLTLFEPTPLPETPVVAFVGRLVEKKGLDVLMTAWPAVRAAVPRARLDVLGAGPLASLLPAGDPSVRHLTPDAGRRATQVREVIAGSRVVATPSHTSQSGDAESLLLVNLEAQASGRPVVTTRHGGIPEFVSDESALLVDENDASALTDALIRVLTDESLAASMSAAGPAVAAEFDVGTCAGRVDELYRSVMRR